MYYSSLSTETIKFSSKQYILFLILLNFDAGFIGIGYKIIAETEKLG